MPTSRAEALSPLSDFSDEETLDVSTSPLKDKQDVHFFNGNSRCKMVDLDSLDNVYVVPILMNGRDTPNLISSRVPSRCQENTSFIVDLDALDNRKDVYCDDNGVWNSTGCKSKNFIVERDASSKVVNITKVANYEDSGFADVRVCRRTYVCESCKSYHRTLVTVEYGKDIQQWFPLVLLNYYYDGTPIKFEVRAHGNRKKIPWHTSGQNKAPKTY